MEGLMPSAAPAPNSFAKRRPCWDLPQLHEGLLLASHADLDREREECPQCHKSRSLYCCDCLVAFTAVPSVQLPCQVSIITHHAEARSNNTGVQAALLAPQHIQLHSLEALPPINKARTVVLFPGPDALDFQDLEPDSIDRIIIIDSKWADFFAPVMSLRRKAQELAGHPSLAGLRHVRLAETRTAFWRFHTAGVADEGVCSVEALLFCLKALVKHGKVTGEQFQQPHAFDNLMYYFAYQHKRIQEKRGLSGAEASADPARKKQRLQQGKKKARGGAEPPQHDKGTAAGATSTPEAGTSTEGEAGAAAVPVADAPAAPAAAEASAGPSSRANGGAGCGGSPPQEGARALPGLAAGAAATAISDGDVDLESIQDVVPTAEEKG